MGKIHSLETFGTVDGPGVRFVVFFQGCPMRCQYCHNPDTWKIEDGEEMTADEIIDRFERNRSFYQTGGITATGGEPMLQLDFLTELLRRQRKRAFTPVWIHPELCFQRNIQEQIRSVRERSVSLE